MTTLATFCKRLFFDAPSHHLRAVGLSFGACGLWTVLFALDHRLWTFPYGLLPLLLLAQGGAEILPTSWHTGAGMLRISALVLTLISGGVLLLMVV